MAWLLWRIHSEGMNRAALDMPSRTILGDDTPGPTGFESVQIGDLTM
jgi:hypothetical protein